MAGGGGAEAAVIWASTRIRAVWAGIAGRAIGNAVHTLPLAGWKRKYSTKRFR